MASEAHSDSEITENQLESSNESWDRYIGLEQILSKYDTVVEIYDGSPSLSPGEGVLEQHGTEYHGLDDATLQPGWDYDSRSDGVEQIRERLDGNSVIVAFGFDGVDLPNYDEIGGELDSRGNWWDHPERLPADILVDDETYSGALKPPRGSQVGSHVFRDQGSLRDVLHLQ